MKWAAAFPFATQKKIVPKFFGLLWSVSSLAKAFSPGQFSFGRCQEAVAAVPGCCPEGHTGKEWESRMEYPSGTSFQQSHQVWSQTLPEWQGKPYLPENDEFPSLLYYCFIPHGAFNFFDWLSYFIAQVLCGILLAFVIAVCFERLTFILLQAFTVRSAANGQAIHFTVNIGLSKCEENMDSI